MKKLLVLLVMGAVYCSVARAQKSDSNRIVIKRRVTITFIEKDSVNLALNESFDRIEDSCSVITRYGHLSRKTRKFFGNFKDVSTQNPALVLTEGHYSDDNLKDGSFVTHYLNGNLQAKGNFKNDHYDGRWEIYYDDGKPRVTFEANGSVVKIINAWDDKGKQIVTDGKGTYRADVGSIYWEGKLVNGLPDGSWSAINAGDVTKVEIVTEKFKNGVFQKGSSPAGAYTDASRLTLVNDDMLPFVEAEKMHIGRPCNSIKRLAKVRAQYPNGRDAYLQYVKDVLRPVFNRIEIRDIEVQLSIDGEIAENGVLDKLNSNSPLFDLSRRLINELRRLPAFVPATIDGKPAREKFRIDFDIHKRGLYRYSLHFLEIENDEHP
jgi:hypothetical protein